MADSPRATKSPARVVEMPQHAQADDAPIVGQADPVFIVGQARSGTTILYRLLQDHPRFRPEAGLSLTESHIMEALAKGGPLNGRQQRAFARAGDGGLAELGPEFARSLRRRIAARVPRRVLVRSPLVWAAVGCEDALRTYLRLAAEGRGAARLVEKTPQHLPWVPHLFRAFPTAKVLVIYRHPVDAFSSFRRRAEEDPKAGWAAFSAEAFVRRWRRELELIAGFARDEGGRFRAVRYETLTAEPDAAQQDVFGWLGEEPLAALPAEVAPSRYAATAERQVFGEIRDLNRHWTDRVSTDEARYIERELLGSPVLVGYASVATAPA